MLSVDGMIRHSEKEISWYTWKLFSPWEDRLLAGISTRKGGFSSFPYSSLNLGHRVGDNPESQAANLAAVSEALGIPGAEWTLCRQVHGTRIAEVRQEKGEDPGDCDALFTDEKNIISAVVLADCLPVVIYDPVRHCGIISHAGWRGTASGIAEKSVQKLIETGSRIEQLLAAVGPGIGSCCYTVGKETAREFSEGFNYPEGVVIRDRKGRYRLNLEKANLSRLRNIGMKENNLGAAGFCTACRNDEFFSYRKEGGLTGRHAALMVLL
jgi:YfiH family protein